MFILLLELLIAVFRGEVSIMLVNMNDKTIEIEKGMRIAQIILFL
jgi:dUTPase